MSQWNLCVKTLNPILIKKIRIKNPLGRIFDFVTHLSHIAFYRIRCNSFSIAMNSDDLNFGGNSLRNLPRLRSFKRRRVSSYDRTGGNYDWFVITPNEKKIIFDVDGPACITHFWTTQAALFMPFYARHVILRIWWDNEPEPSVECPLSDFFGCGHGEFHNFTSAPLQMSPRGGKGFNSWWPMPFRKHARIEITNENEKKINVYFYVDYELYDKFPEDSNLPIGYFHAQFRRVDYKTDIHNDFDTGKKISRVNFQMAGKNTLANGGYEKNHIILEAKGKGQYVGCHLDIDNCVRFNLNWPGEGDDMIWIDDDLGKEPTLYGTGTEDYVNQAFSQQEKYSAPYHGTIKPGGFNWAGKITFYRYHIQDPVSFEKQIKVSIEHGHANTRGDIWESTAYWYQTEPHAKFPQLPNKAARTPRKERNWKIWFLFGIIAVVAICWKFVL